MTDIPEDVLRLAREHYSKSAYDPVTAICRAILAERERNRAEVAIDHGLIRTRFNTGPEGKTFVAKNRP